MSKGVAHPNGTQYLTPELRECATTAPDALAHWTAIADLRRAAVARVAIVNAISLAAAWTLSTVGHAPAVVIVLLAHAVSTILTAGLAWRMFEAALQRDAWVVLERSTRWARTG